MMKKIVLALLLIFPVMTLAEMQTSLTDSAVQLTAITKQEKDKTLNYRIQMAYPQISIEQFATFSQQFNKLMQNQIQQNIQRFKEHVTKNQTSQLILPKILGGNSLFINYEADSLKLNNTPIISVRFKVETYYSGMAHPTHVHSVTNYDLNTGKVLTLKELFLPDADYLTAIASYCEKTLKKSLPKNAFFNNGVKPTLTNYALWNLHPDGLFITFDEYQVAPYAFGPQTVTIPYASLSAILVTPFTIISSLTSKQRA